MANNAKDSKGNPRNTPQQQKTTKNAKSSFTDIHFINVNMSEQWKRAFEQWYSEPRDLLALADDILRGGYKISSGEEVSTGTIMVTITNRTGQPEFVSHCFTLRGAYFHVALARVIFVHAFICEGDWNVIATPSDVSNLW